LILALVLILVFAAAGVAAPGGSGAKSALVTTILANCPAQLRCDFLDDADPTLAHCCPRGALHVVVRGVRTGGRGSAGGGQLRLILFSSGGAFESDVRYRGQQAETISSSVIGPSEVTFDFPRLLQHEYGIIAHHDKDWDSAVDDFLGYPLEALAASRGARGGPWGGPRWRDANFRHEGPETTITLDLWYP